MYTSRRSLLQNDFHRSVKVARNIPASSDTKEYIVTSCCTTGLTENFNAAALTVVDLHVNESLNYAEATRRLSCYLFKVLVCLFVAKGIVYTKNISYKIYFVDGIKHLGAFVVFIICNSYGFYAPGSNDRGHIVFVQSVCLSVCFSVVNFNMRYNFWTVKGGDFIFGMHTPLMMPFQMIPRSMTLWPSLWHLL